jgi:hypothetical protein
MCNIKDNISIFNPNNTNSSSYSSINYNNLDYNNTFFLPSIFNDNDLESQYIEDKINMEKYLYDIKSININLLNKIRCLNKICYYVNIKNSNTINFIMKNFKYIKKILNNYIFLYNENIDKINMTNKKINDINMNILYIKHKY